MSQNLKPEYYIWPERHISGLTGIVVDEGTLRKWINEGIGGVRLWTFWRRCKLENVLDFISEVSVSDPRIDLRRFPHELQALMQGERVFHKLSLAIAHVTGRSWNPMSVRRWYMQGHNDQPLQTWRLGKRRITTLSSVQEFWSHRESTKDMNQVSSRVIG